MLVTHQISWFGWYTNNHRP